MKGFNFRFLFTICVMFILAGLSHREVSARKIKIKIEKTGPYAEKLGDEMFAYAKKETRRTIKEYWKNEDGDYDNISVFFGMNVTKKDSFTLCKPYVSWSDENPQQPSYKFPIVVKEKIVALLIIYGRIEEPKYMTASLLDEMEVIEQLNKLDYLHKDYVFFGYKGVVLAQGEDGKIKKFLEDPYAYHEPDRKPSDTEKFFRALDYNKKLELLLKKMDDFAFTEEVDARRKAIIDGTFTGDESVPATFIPRQTTPTPKPDASKEANTDFYSLLSVAVVAGAVTFRVIVFVIVKIKKLRGK